MFVLIQNSANIQAAEDPKYDLKRRAVKAAAFSYIAGSSYLDTSDQLQSPKSAEKPLKDYEEKLVLDSDPKISSDTTGLNPQIQALAGNFKIISKVSYDGIEETALGAASEALMASTSGMRAVTFEMEDGTQHVSFRGTQTPYGAITDVVLLCCAATQDPRSTFLDFMTKIAVDYAPKGTPKNIIDLALDQAITHTSNAISKVIENREKKDEEKDPEEQTKPEGLLCWISGFLAPSDDSWLKIGLDLLWELGGATLEASHEALIESLPEDMKLAIKTIGSQDPEDFKDLIKSRMDKALAQAEDAILKSHATGKLVGISGHSLGGITAELAASKLIAAGKLSPDFEVSCFCSPGGKQIFDFMGIPYRGTNILHVARAGDVISRGGGVLANYKWEIPILSKELIDEAYEWLEENQPFYPVVAHGIKPTVWALVNNLAKEVVAD